MQARLLERWLSAAVLVRLYFSIALKPRAINPKLVQTCKTRFSENLQELICLFGGFSLTMSSGI